MNWLKSWIPRLLTGAATVALLWLVLAMYHEGQAYWAVALLGLGSLAIYVYTSSRSLAWRYLFPGVTAMLVFVAFPLYYTVQIGFSNYSSSNLLSQQRARSYLLDQGESDQSQALQFTLHPEAGQWRLRLSPADNPTGPIYETPVLKLDGTDNSPVALHLTTDPAHAAALDLRHVLQHRGVLMALKLQTPQQQLLSYAGVREFAPFIPTWQAAEGGGLVQRSSGQIYRPNLESGFFENSTGQRLQPGFTVGVGWRNYERVFVDPDMRGPFLSIFLWTVSFAALTVLFATAIGMTLAVALNWDALRHRALYRTLLFLPYAVPGFISILVFKGLFNPNFGEINALLNAVFGVRPAWFADPLLARSMILMVNTWLGYPYIMILCTGLIKAIPADLYEASAIVGAGPWTNFWRITVPLIVRPLTPLLISAFAFNFNNFVLISLLTDGRPDYLNTKLPAGTTDILVSYTYRIAFTDAGANFGLAATISTIIFVLVALLSWLNLRITASPDALRS